MEDYYKKIKSECIDNNCRIKYIAEYNKITNKINPSNNASYNWDGCRYKSSI